MRDVGPNLQKAHGELPPLNRSLLLYLLDLWAIFASKEDANRMSPLRIADVFQSSVLYHPDDSNEEVDRLFNSNVLKFLIENQDNFLLEMSGVGNETTSVDDEVSGLQLNLKHEIESNQVRLRESIKQKSR